MKTASGACVGVVNSGVGVLESVASRSGGKPSNGASTSEPNNSVTGMVSIFIFTSRDASALIDSGASIVDSKGFRSISADPNPISNRPSSAIRNDEFLTEDENNIFPARDNIPNNNSGKRKSLGTRRLRKGELLFDMNNDRHNIPTSDDTFATPIKAAANRFEPRALE